MRKSVALSILVMDHASRSRVSAVTEPPNYDGPHVPIIVIMTFDSRTYVPHNLKGLFSSEQDPITGVLQYYNSLFKYLQSKVAEVLHNLSLQTTFSKFQTLSSIVTNQ
jgi:hypothetical protein